jgi:hypothetical protein
VLFGSCALPGPQEDIDYTSLTTIHTRLTRLRTIIFNTPCEEYITTFVQCTFPRLSRFISELPVTTDVVLFLDRHPMIQCLELITFRFIDQTNTTEHQPLPKFPLIRLPNLTRFVGPAYVVPSIFPTSSNMEKVVICWDAQFSHDSNIIPIVEALSRMDPPLMAISCLRYDWGTQLMDLISCHMSDVASISIFNLAEAAPMNREEEKVRVYKTSH